MFLPHEKLKDWIKVFWFLEGKGQGKNFYTRNILPDGCATICFVLDGYMDLTIYKNGVIKKGIYIIPPVVNSHIDTISDNINLIDVQLNPCLFYKLFNIPANQLENKIYTIDELSLDFDETFLERLYTCKNNKNVVYTMLNSFFINLFDKFNFKSDEIVFFVNELYKDGNLEKFYKEQNLSVRQLERKVKQYSGLTPKNLSRLGRFYSVLDYIKYRQFDLEFSEIAFEYKFSDQSHFIREFKSFTNITPKKFIKDTNSSLQFKGICNLTKVIN